MLRNSCLLSILLIVAVRHRVSCRARLFLTGFVSPCRPTFATLYLVLFGEQKVYLCLFMMLCQVMSTFVCRLPNSGPAAFLGSMPSDV